MSQFAPRAKIGLRPREGRQTFIVVAVGACLSLGLLASGGYIVSHQQPTPAAAPGDNKIYTGSILYMPYEGKICRQLLFDNHTGLLSDNGTVDCERAAYQSMDNTPKRWSFARMRVISSGFRDR